MKRILIAIALIGLVSCKKEKVKPLVVESKSSLYGKFWYRDKSNFPMGFMAINLSSYTYVDDTGGCWTDLDNYDDWRIKEKTATLYNDTLCQFIDNKWTSIYSEGRLLYFLERDDSLFCIYKETSLYTGDTSVPIYYSTCFMGKRIP
jgi:hypothetical protein